MILIAVFLTLSIVASQPLQVSSAGSAAVVFAVAPVYPQLAVLSATSGTVDVDLAVDGNGRVVAVGAINGHQLLKDAAEQAALRWEFERGGNGRRVRLVFTFRIMPRGTSDAELTSSFSPPYNCEVRRTVPDIPPDR
jgi:hypothetical protein